MILTNQFMRRSTFLMLLSFMLIASPQLTHLVYSQMPQNFTGTISGAVTDQNTGQPIPNIPVGAYKDGFWAGDCTDQNGNYTITNVILNEPLRVDSAQGLDNHCDGQAHYVVELWQETNWWHEATLITLTSTDPAATGIDFTLELGGTVTGRVVDQTTGLPIPDLHVSAYSDDFWAYGCTDTDGYYTIPDVLFNSPFRVEAAYEVSNRCGGSEDYAKEYWQENADFNNATLLTLDANNQHQTGINFTLELGGTVAGTVIDEVTSLPLANMVVEVASLSLATCTDGNGAFELGNIPLNTDFIVRAGGFHNGCAGGSQEYAIEHWQEQYVSFAANTLRLTSTTPDLTGIDFTLVKGGIVTGRVVDQTTDAPIANMLIGAASIDFPNGFYSPACTDANGDFTIVEIPRGWQFYVSTGGPQGPLGCGNPDNYVEEYWQETSDWTSKTLLTLTDAMSQIDAVNFTLEVGTLVTGQVTHQGQPLANMSVVAYGANLGFGTCTDPNGNYSFLLPRGKPVYLRAGGGDNFCENGSNDFANEFWNEAPNEAQATPLTLATEQPVTDIDFTLVMVLPGDCNADGLLDAADVSALALEIADNDGTDAAAVRNDGFFGHSVGCDADGNATIDATDTACVRQRLFDPSTSCSTP